MRVTVTQFDVPPPISAAVATGIVAQPGGQSGATPLTARVNIVTTIAPNTAVLLQVIGGNRQEVVARGGAPLPVYPALGTLIEGNAVNVPVTVADKTSAIFTFDGLKTWVIDSVVADDTSATAIANAASSAAVSAVSIANAASAAAAAAETMAQEAENSAAEAIQGSTLSAHGILVALNSGTATVLPLGTAGQALISGGGTAAPSWQNAGGGGANPITNATSVSSVAGTDFVGISQGGADKHIEASDLFNSTGTTVADYLSANTATPTGTDKVLAVQGANAVGESLSDVAAYVLGQFPSATLSSVIISSTTPFPLDHSVHHRRVLVCTVAATINAPGTFATVGDGFDCTVINVSGADVTFGGGIILTAGGSTLPDQSIARVYGISAGGTNHIFVATGGTSAPATGLSLAPISGTQYTDGSGTIAVSGTYNTDGAPSAATYTLTPGSGSPITGSVTIGSASGNAWAGTIPTPSVSTSTSYTLSITGTAGNTDTTNTRSVTVAPPTIAITSPAANASVAQSSTINISGTDAGGSTPTAFDYSFDGSTWSACGGTLTASGGNFSGITAPAPATGSSATLHLRRHNQTAATATVALTLTGAAPYTVTFDGSSANPLVDNPTIATNQQVPNGFWRIDAVSSANPTVGATSVKLIWSTSNTAFAALDSGTYGPSANGYVCDVHSAPNFWESSSIAASPYVAGTFYMWAEIVDGSGTYHVVMPGSLIVS